MIPQDTVGIILDTARIVDVVSDFVTLKRRGANYVACCPFHNEKTPSFYVSPSKGIYKCFGCGKSGTAVGFVMEHEHCSYVDALRYLARKYNIEIIEKEETAEDIAQRQRRESLMLVSEFAQKFYAQRLRQTPEGRNVGLAYFKSRGLEDSTIDEYGLGWAPTSRHALVDAASEAGFKAEYLVDTGLCNRRDDGSLSDRFYDRVVFPIQSVSGRVIAFGCRTLRSDYKEMNVGKYVNSQESEIYVKRNTLYGIYHAKGEISRQNKCYLVEGYLDVLSMHQLGLRNTVASSGTSLTVEQVRLIKKFTDNVTIMYDGDSAGIHAAIRGIDMVLKEDLNVRIVLIPDGDDPDSYARKHSLEEVQEFIGTHEQDFINFKAELLMKDAGKDPIRKANLINEIADTIANISDAVKRTVYVQAVSDRFGIDQSILFTRISSTRRKMLADERKEIERESRRRAAKLPPLPEEYPQYQSSGQSEEEITMQSLEENKTVASTERDLLWFLLQYGRDTLDFSSDSKYYSGSEDDKATVAEFISASLEADGDGLINKAYQRVYEAYMEGYAAGYSQNDILKTLLNSQDRVVAFVVSQLSMERYQLTVENFRNALTTRSSWLVKYVPQTILKYMDRKIESRISDLNAALAAANPGEENDILTEILNLQAAKKAVNKELQ